MTACHSSLQKFKALQLTFSAIVVAISLPTLLGQNQTAFFSAWKTMQYNSALGILMTGLAVGALALELEIWASIFSSLVMLLAGATLFEHLATVDLGIDQIFHDAVVSVYDHAPGRMALLSSAILVLLSSAIFLQQRKTGRAWWFAGLLASSSAALGLLSPFGSHFSAQFDFASAAKMSKAAGIAFFFAGTLLLSLAILKIRTVKEEKFRVLPLLITSFLGFLLLLGWQYSIQRQENNIREQLEIQNQQAQKLFVERLDQTMMAIGRYVSRIALVGTGNKDYLRLDSSNYAAQLKVIRRIGVTDENFKVVWSYPEDLQYQVNGFNQTAEPERRETFEAARDLNVPVLSKFVDLKSGEIGCVVSAPIYAGTRFKGAGYATLSMDRLFAGYVKPEQFSLSVSETGRAAYSRSATSPTISEIQFKNNLKVGFADWTITASPTTAYLNDLTQAHPTYFLVIGELLILIFGLLVENLSRASHARRHFHEREQLAFHRLNTSMEAAKIAAFSLEFETGKIWRSKNLDAILGYTTPAADWTMNHFLDRLHEDDKERFLEAQKVAFGSRGSQVREVRIRRQIDGTIRWLRIITQTTFDANGVAMNIEGVLIDTTEEKSTALKLRAAHERLQRVVESSTEGIWERNLDNGEISYFDDNCRAIFGFDHGETITSATVLNLILEEDRPTVQKAFDEHLTNKTPGFLFELRLRDHRNPLLVKWIRARGQILTLVDGTRQLVSTLRDISNEVMNRRQLELAVEEAHDAVRAKSTFLANMSHEIRTPLNGIIGMTDLLLESELNSAQRKFAEIAQQSGESLLHLINDVLDFSKVEAGKLELDASQFNVAMIVESQVDIMMAKAQEKGISVASYISADVPSLVRGDSGRLGQVLLNLIGNAIKFTKSGGVMVNVEKRMSADGVHELLNVRVRDTGIGISETAAKRLFSPFVQAEAGISNTYGGTGLGLSICKKIVEAMGGSIGIESVVGSGSTFWFEIPLWAVHGVSISQKVGWEKLLEARTLVVEHDSIVRESLDNYLTSFKMRNSSAANLTDAADLLRNAALEGDPYQLVLIGLNDSPSPRHAIQILKASAGHHLPACLLITEFGVHEDFTRLQETGYAGLVSKPVKQSPLLGSIVSALNPTVIHVESRVAAQVASHITANTEEFRILVADDVNVNLMLTEKMLDFLGYTSMCVANGLEVLEILKQSKFDLILMDCQMPELNGFETTKAIRESKEKWIREIPIIALTANAMSGDDKLCIEAGMNDYLSKPMKKEQLAEKLRHWLQPGSDKKSA